MGGFMRHLLLLPFLVSACVQVYSAQAAGKEKDEDAVNWSERAVPGPAVLLRLRQKTNKLLIYEGASVRSQKAESSYEEKSGFYLGVYCASQNDEGIKHLCLQRTYTDRQRSEVLANKKKVEQALPNSTDLVNLGPNFQMIGEYRCYGFNTQNRMAHESQQLATLKDGRQIQGAVLAETGDTISFLTSEDKFDIARDSIASLEAVPVPHLFFNETPHHFFPMLSKNKVAPGDTWKFKLPVIIPAQQGNPPRLLRSQFTVCMIGRLREVRTVGTAKIAIVDYQVQGEFDSKGDEFKTRFPDAFHESNRVRHRVSGGGVASIDVDNGRLLEKTEDITVTLLASAMIVPEDEKGKGKGKPKEPKLEENKVEISSHYQIKLAPPGAKLSTGAAVPDYD
jgi:hypothetical protein